MITFQTLLERLIDPVDLAQRASSRFGKRQSYGKWDKTEKGKHIPLTSFNRRKSDSADNRLYNVQQKFGMHDKDSEKRQIGSKKYEEAHKKKSFEIKHLTATQPFVRTGNIDKLKNKIDEKNPQHIHVVTHKGVHYIADGHHAVMAAKLRGDKHVVVNHLDMDSLK